VSFNSPNWTPVPQLLPPFRARWESQERYPTGTHGNLRGALTCNMLVSGGMTIQFPS